jgi:SnoaL-like protein
MNTDNESQLRELLDREHIRDLVHRYCWAVDRGTLEEVMALFHTECNLALVPGKRYLGREATYRWYDVYMQNRMEVLRHLIHNQVITVRVYPETFCVFTRPLFDNGIQAGAPAASVGALTECD